MAQTTSYKKGKAHNIERAGGMMKEAAENGASLILFPEMYLTGYTAGKRLPDIAEPADGESFCKMAEYAREAGIHVVYGYPGIRTGPDGRGLIYNSANLVSDSGELIGTYSKSRLFAGEKKNFTPGTEYPVFDTKLGKIGMLICYDIEFPEPARRLAVKGADLIACIAANMAPVHELHARYAPVRALENTIHIAYCNYAGSDDRFDYTGRSGLFKPDGVIFCEGASEGSGADPADLAFRGGADREAEGLIYADADLAEYDREDDEFGYIPQLSEDEAELYRG